MISYKIDKFMSNIMFVISMYKMFWLCMKSWYWHIRAEMEYAKLNKFVLVLLKNIPTNSEKWNFILIFKWKKSQLNF